MHFNINFIVFTAYLIRLICLFTVNARVYFEIRFISPF